MNTATTYSRLLELLTARDYTERHGPHLLDLLPDPDAAFREDTEAAKAVAAEYGIPPSPTGQYPFVIWTIANDPAHVGSRSRRPAL
jgi:hypothetical protein